MAKWLLKTEPNDYSYADLQQEGHTIWDGVTNNWALKHMREVRKGDQAMIYHTGKEKCIAGIARVKSDPYPDPSINDEKRIVFDIEPVKKLSGQIKLGDLKKNPFFSDFLLVKFTRLSVMPVDLKHWEKLLEMDELSG
jgi:predicted RNA-binding protein with PUA-like domain